MRIASLVVFLLVPLAGRAQTPAQASGLDLRSDRIVPLSGTDLGSSRVVERFRVSALQMERLLADRRFSRAVQRVDDDHVEAADGFVLQGAAPRGGTADCTAPAACYVVREGGRGLVLIVSPVDGR